MTQRFLDDGTVERVTVLEAGPCPVTGIRTLERDGYEAVQLAFGACKEKVLTRAELGHLKKADASAHRVVARVPRRGRRAARRRDRHRRGVRRRRQGEDLRHRRRARASPGTIKRHNFSQRPEVPRLAQRPRAGLDRRLGHALARVQGRARPRPDGRRPDHPARPHRRRDDPGAEPAARARRRPRAPRRRRWRCGPMARTAPKLGGGTVELDAGRSRRASTCRSSTRPCAPSSTPAGRAPRRPRPAARSAAAAPSRGARRAPAAPARARSARRTSPAAASCSARSPRHYTVKVNRKARRAALRSALSVHAERGSRSPCSTPPCSTARPTKQAAGLLADWGAASPALVLLTEAEAAAGKSFRNLAGWP